ncbi:MAG: hypothetical protein IKZ19_05345, partial [Clostridia bacterium]|nr:hypothetical protein [Clostridia bacterium]
MNGKIKWLALLVLVLISAAFAGCGSIEPDVTLPVGTGLSDNQGGNINQLPENENEPGETTPIKSSRIERAGDCFVYVDPTDRHIKLLDTVSGEISAVSERSAYGEFFLDESLVWFCDESSGTIVSVNIYDGTESEHYSLPLGRGIKIGDRFFFVDDRDYGEETALYVYDTAGGRWENLRLSGNRCSANRDTVVFDIEGVWYISQKNNTSNVCFTDFETLNTTVVYTSENPNGVFELLLNDRNLYFAETGKGVYTVKYGSGEAVRFIDSALRMYDKNSYGVFYQRSYGYPSKLYIGNERGTSVDVKGGVVVSSYASRTLLRRIVDGSEQLVMVKYPEDTVVYSRDCSVYGIVSNGRYAMAFLNDSRYIYLFDIGSGKTECYENGEIEYSRVSLEEYYSDTCGKCAPSLVALAKATDRDVAELFVTAVSRNDMFTVGLLLADGAYITPYESFKLKSFGLEKLSEEENCVKYSVSYTY